MLPSKLVPAIQSPLTLASEAKLKLKLLRTDIKKQYGPYYMVCNIFYRTAIKLSEPQILKFFIGTENLHIFINSKISYNIQSTITIGNWNNSLNLQERRS